MVFAIINSKKDKNVEEKLRKLIDMAVEESLSYESMYQVTEFARKKQVQLIIDDMRKEMVDQKELRVTPLVVSVVCNSFVLSTGACF